MSNKKAKQPEKVPFYRHKLFLWSMGTLVGLVLITFLAFRFTPWPSILLVRIVFDRGSHQTSVALQKHTPKTPITVIENQQYDRGDRRAQLDVYTPTSAVQSGQALPVVVWTHGGAWVSGSKSDNAPYFKLLAAQGFTVVALNYTLAPEKTYPTQLFEINKAHAYVLANATRFHINPDKVFLAGDSAGAHLTSQMAALATDPAYAKEVGIKPALKSSQIAGTVLFCGIYKVAGLAEASPNLPKLINWGDDQVVWAFSGSRDRFSPAIQQMSTYYHVTKNFPATFISGGNDDPLTDKQSKPLADKLEGLGVAVTTLFYPADHQPGLPHEYQFNLDNSDGQKALDESVQFMQKRAE